MKSSFAPIAILTLIAALSSCSGKEKQAETFDRNDILTANDRIDRASVYDYGDTAEVMRLTKEYLDYLKGDMCDAALSMLYKVDVKEGKADMLDEDQAKRVLRNMQLFPVENYTINEVRFYSDSDTEVSYTINQSEDGQPGPSNAMKCMLCFRKIDGRWYATVLDNDYVR